MIFVIFEDINTRSIKFCTHADTEKLESHVYRDCSVTVCLLFCWQRFGLWHSELERVVLHAHAHTDGVFPFCLIPFWVAVYDRIPQFKQYDVRQQTHFTFSFVVLMVSRAVINLQYFTKKLQHMAAIFLHFQ